MQQLLLKVLESATFHWVAGVCLGSMITVLLTVWCQRQLIKEQYNLQKKIAEDERAFQKRLAQEQLQHDRKLQTQQQTHERNLEYKRQESENLRDIINHAR